MKSLGETIRNLREEKKLPLRTVAAHLDIDQAILSKIERGQRNAKREHVIKLARFFKVPENDLLVDWLSDKLVFEIADEDMGLKALQAAEEKVSYQAKPQTDKAVIIHSIQKVLKNDGRVAAAWLFGSMARNEDQPNSDVDIMVELNSTTKYSMFDLLDIAHILEQKINRKVDLVEKGSLSRFAAITAAKDLVKIYG